MKRLESMEKLRAHESIDQTRMTDGEQSNRTIRHGVFASSGKISVKEKIERQNNTPIRMEQSATPNQKYIGQFKDIIKKIQENTSSSSPSQKEVAYQIKSQNLFMQGPQSMISRDIQSKLSISNGDIPEIKMNRKKNQSRDCNLLNRNSSMETLRSIKDQRHSSQFLIRKGSQPLNSSSKKQRNSNAHTIGDESIRCYEDLTESNTLRIDEKVIRLDDFNEFENSNNNNNEGCSNRNDTRFRELQRLSSENFKLKARIKELELEIAEMDEFRMALKYRDKADDINEKRIDLMKAQLTRQYKYIKRLTSLLQGTKKIFKDNMSIIQFFSETATKAIRDEKFHNYQQQVEIHQNQLLIQPPQQLSQKDNLEQIYEEEEKNKLLPSEDGMLAQLDQKIIYSQVHAILSNERDSFLRNFTSAYQKILAYERENKSFLKIFKINKNEEKIELISSIANIEIQEHIHNNHNNEDSHSISENQIEKEFKIKYNHPVTTFLKKYQKYLPINTIFSSFPSQKKDTLHNMLSVLQSTVKKCDREFKQIRVFQLFKSNPFLYVDSHNRLDLPETLAKYKGDFESYLKFRDSMVSINLSQSEISKTESNLAVVLDQLLQLYGDTIKKQMNDTSFSTQTLIQNLKLAIEQLISLGVIIGHDSALQHSRFVVVSNKVSTDVQNNFKTIKSKIMKQLTLKSEKKIASESRLSSQRQINQNKSSFNQQNEIKKQQKILDELNDLEQLKTLVILKDLNCTNEFFDQHSMCENIFEDMYKRMKNKDIEESIQLALKLGSIINKLKLFFEMKNNMLLIKEAQIDYLKNQIFLHKQDISQCQVFVNDQQQQINLFFGSIQSKLSELLLQFNNVMDGSKNSDPKSKKNLILLFKKSLKEIIQSINLIEDKNSPFNQFTFKQLQQQFIEQVELVTTHIDSLNKMNS